MTLIKLIPYLFLSLLMGVPSAAAVELRVGFVDIPFLIDKAPQAIEASARLERMFAPRQQTLKSQRDEMNLLRTELEKEGLVMAQDKRAQLELDIRARERKLKRDQQDFREELNIKKNNEFKKVRAAILKSISQLAEREKFDLVLNEGVLYASKRIDITGGVLDILQATKNTNKQLGDRQ